MDAASYVRSLDLQGRVSRNPYQTLLIAAGVGYILGGGLFSRLTVNVLRMGVKVAGLPMVQRQLLGVAEAALAPRPSADNSQSEFANNSSS
ncbi:MAG: hypothetical protein Q8P18_18085 [Pseudomonadota bacterium]|nr:hypothetical protein [Pseudomonadota bacterium]